MSSGFERLEDVVLDEVFPDVDLALRRGRHIDRDDGNWYSFLVDAEALLIPLYRRYGAELVHRSDGYFFLLPNSDKLGKKHLSVAEMLVGQALTLLYLDPGTVQQGGVVTREQVLAHLASVMGSDALVHALNPKRRRYDERVAQETARARVAEAIRRLCALGFAETLPDDKIRLRPGLMRFAEPVRGQTSPGEALQRLVAAGEVVLAPEGQDDGGDDDDHSGADDELASEAELTSGEQDEHQPSDPAPGVQEQRDEDAPRDTVPDADGQDPQTAPDEHVTDEHVTEDERTAPDEQLSEEERDARIYELQALLDEDEA